MVWSIVLPFLEIAEIRVPNLSFTEFGLLEVVLKRRNVFPLDPLLPQMPLRLTLALSMDARSRLMSITNILYI